MNSINMSFVQSLKVWWSFLWRAWILMFPPMIVLGLILLKIMPIPKPGEPPQIPNRGVVLTFIVVYLIMMVSIVVTQVFAMQWALKTRWSDFKLVAVPRGTVEAKQLHLDK